MEEEYIDIRLYRKDLELIKEALQKYYFEKVKTINQNIKKEILEERKKFREFLQNDKKNSSY